ncbi:hypothetical protein [Achromobacter xylosoxidans]|uniref:hypothetical protein n=1 Tax=Alcaligenes xylosoxydans xylosoxydans TaxID=85698 RepID=UPI000AFD5914
MFTTLAVYNQVSPPTINIFNQDPECDLDYCANEARQMKIDVGLSNSFASAAPTLHGRFADLIWKAGKGAGRLACLSCGRAASRRCQSWGWPPRWPAS